MENRSSLYNSRHGFFNRREMRFSLSFWTKLDDRRTPFCFFFRMLARALAVSRISRRNLEFFSRLVKASGRTFRTSFNRIVGRRFDSNFGEHILFLIELKQNEVRFQDFLTLIERGVFWTDFHRVFNNRGGFYNSLVFSKAIKLIDAHLFRLKKKNKIETTEKNISLRLSLVSTRYKELDSLLIFTKWAHWTTIKIKFNWFWKRSKSVETWRWWHFRQSNVYKTISVLQLSNQPDETRTTSQTFRFATNRNPSSLSIFRYSFGLFSSKSTIRFVQNQSKIRRSLNLVKTLKISTEIKITKLFQFRRVFLIFSEISAHRLSKS